MERLMKLVAVTSCPTGIAHSQMAAENLEQTAPEMGHDIHVEVQGAMGAENELSPETIADADLDSVVDIRGRGLMFAVEFDTKDRREAVVKEALHRGLLTLGCGYKSLRLLPPLDVTEREIELGANLFIEAAEAAERDAPVATTDSSDAY